VLIILAMTALVAIFATVMVLRTKRPPVTATTATADLSATPPIPSATADLITTDPAASSSAQNTAQNTAPDAGATIAAVHTATHATSHVNPGPAPTHKPPPAPTSGVSNCDPPWTIDPATGRKKYKLECPL
jgi:hypothetical protein